MISIHSMNLEIRYIDSKVIDCFLHGENAQTDERKGFKLLELIIAASISALKGVATSLLLEH